MKNDIQEKIDNLKVGNTYFSRFNPMRVYEITAVGETTVSYKDDYNEYRKPIYEFIQNFSQML